MRVEAIIDLTCEMTDDCSAPVTRIDDKGFIYCESHGLSRKRYCRCRRLTPKEIKRLTAEEQLASYCV